MIGNKNIKPLSKNYLKYIDYYTQYNILNRDRIRKRNKKKKEHIKKVKRAWYLKNKKSIALKQKIYRDNRKKGKK